ncbi:MAG: hypothetical protein KA258_02850 [Deltaproteobacteria bacterium]|jgi:hypothetical protein|nr:hypothetical protein [Deltaproteobacteria bacterium]
MAAPSAESGGRLVLVPRLPRVLQALAVVILCIGVFQLLAGMLEVNTAILTDRSTFISSVRDRQLSMFDQLAKDGPDSLASPLRPLGRTLLRLPRPEAERLFLLLGADLYERRNVTVPMAMLQSILGFLLITGSLAALRNRLGGVALWGWACLVNIPATLLSLVVMMVHANRLMHHVGLPAAEALAKVSSRPVAVETTELEALLRMYTSAQTALLAGWVLFLGVVTLVLQNRQGPPLPVPRDE